ncbi:MAG: HAD family hydrolase [Chloroflexota bacterium]|nr:HAD family hydrolase [Chloroflexota bacterium]
MDISRISTLSFDADGTLWDHDGAMHKAMHFTLDELYRRLPDLSGAITVDQMITTRLEIGHEFQGSDFGLDDLRAIAFRRTLEKVGVNDPGLASYLTAIYQKRRLETMALFSDTNSTLNALADKFSLGIVTNGTTDPEWMGLQGIFRFVVMAEEHGVQKPDTRIFEIALDQAGCDPHEIIHIGDSLEDDIKGANDAGITSVWLNPRVHQNTTGIHPTYEVSGLAELVGLLCP